MSNNNNCYDRKEVEGVYNIKPLFRYAPRFILKIYKEENNELKGKIGWWRITKKIYCVKHKKSHLIFRLDIEVIEIDIVVNFDSVNFLKGFIDTPIGHLKFNGYRKMRKI